MTRRPARALGLRGCSWFALAPGLLLLAACGSSGARSTTSAAGGAGPHVEDTTWELGLDVLGLPGVDNARPTLKLSGGTASGWAGCNTYTAPYTLGSGTLSFGNVAQTAMGCEPVPTAIENAYLSRLAKVAKYSVTSSGAAAALQLQDSSGATVLAFTAANASLEGNWTVTGYLSASGSAFMSVVNGSHLTANFGADGRVTGDTGCNNYNGPWKQGPGDAVTIGPLATTRKACTTDELSAQEHSFVEALSISVKVEVTSSSATLLNAAGLRTVTMTR